MPYIVHGETSTNQRWDIYNRKDFNYEYPNDLDLKPGSDFHNMIASRIYQRATESRTELSNRFKSWRELDQIMTVYTTLDDKEKLVKKKDSRRPVSIVFPYTYSMLEALLTYMVQAFFQDPMFQYEGVEDDDVLGAMLLELVIRLHCIKSKVPLALHTILRDCLMYGVGIGIPGWITKHGRVPMRSTTFVESELGGSQGQFINYVDKVIYEGNDLTPVDPYMWLPDPTVSSSNIQDGEFVGWIERDNYMNLLTEEYDNENMFNVKYVGLKRDKKSVLSRDQSERQTKHGMNDSNMSQGRTASTSPTDTINMYIKLIPKEWKLSDSERPEKWFFQLAADDVVTSCYRADHNHAMFPIGVASPEFDGYSISPIGRMEILYGLQGTLDFLFNSHIANVRKSINDMLIVDPYLVNINDLKDPQPGKLIRTRRPAWGHGVDKVVQQLKIQDITKANIADSAYITQWMDRISGADQSMQGSLRSGGPERLTKSEFQGTRASSVSRLQRLAMIIGMQFMQDIGTMFAVHTQQYMQQDVYVKLVGRQQEQFEEILGPQRGQRVSPFDLAVSYDIIVRDGSIPGGNFSTDWVQLFQTIASTPELHQQFDVFRIFMYIAQQMGAKNVEDFKRVANQTNVQALPDEQVARETERGNLVPLEGGL